VEITFYPDTPFTDAQRKEILDIPCDDGTTYVELPMNQELEQVKPKPFPYADEVSRYVTDISIGKTGIEALYLLIDRLLLKERQKASLQAIDDCLEAAETVKVMEPCANDHKNDDDFCPECEMTDAWNACRMKMLSAVEKLKE